MNFFPSLSATKGGVPLLNPPVQNLRRPETSISAKLREGATETEVVATEIGCVEAPVGGAHVVLREAHEPPRSTRRQPVSGPDGLRQGDDV